MTQRPVKNTTVDKDTSSSISNLDSFNLLFKYKDKKFHHFQMKVTSKRKFHVLITAVIAVVLMVS